VRYVYGVPGEKAGEDTLFVATDNDLYVATGIFEPFVLSA
jgi:hypothetical protein